MTDGITLDVLLGGAVALLVLGFFVYVLFHPERF